MQAAAPTPGTARTVRTVRTAAQPEGHQGVTGTTALAADARPGYQPALDGLRAVAVVLVLAFHLGVPGVDGGYLGVSVFFTLSGYLITRLLLEEHERHARIRLARFYGRRARRLLPASLVALGGVAALAVVGAVEASDRLRAGIVAALLQVSNWYELLSGRTYADLFAEPDPLAHYWSLAIEQQFYWLWPVVLLAVARSRFGASPAARAWTVTGLAAACAVSAPLTARWWSNDAAYFATWARAAEILAGAALAAWLARTRSPARAVPAPWSRHLALPALATILVVTWLTPAGRGWAYEGWLPVFALVTVALLLGLQHPSVTASALSLAPVVWLGRISYGVYLFHWPVIVWLDEARTGLDGVALGALRVAVTMTVAVLSYRLVERPVLERRVLGSPRTATVAAVAGTLGLVGVAVAVVPGSEPVNPDAPAVIAAPSATPPANGSSAGPGADPSTEGATSPATAPPPPDGSAATTPPAPTVVAVFGDSVPAWLLRDAAPSFVRTDVVLLNGSAEACDGMVDLPVGRDRRGDELRPPPECRPWTDTYPATLAATDRPTDVAVLVLGQAPTVDHLVDGTWLHPCTSIEWYLADVERRIAWLREQGVEVVFALPAPPGTGATFVLPDDAADRLACVRAALEARLASLQVPMIDLAEVLCPEGDCDAVRDDGTHVAPEHAPAVLDWLIDRALATA